MHTQKKKKRKEKKGGKEGRKEERKKKKERKTHSHLAKGNPNLTLKLAKATSKYFLHKKKWNFFST